ncbi:MAG: hypothetical protein LBT14_00570, partial [Treponema sp.]|nr:hypothetical protein [Treponema sp.]
MMVSCSNLFDPPVEKPAAGELQAKGAGRVRVLITEGSAGVRTLLPETPVFSTYQISFTNGSATDTMTIIPAALGPVATYLDLAVGTWTLGVTGYATFNSAEYAAAYGERTGIIVENGITIDVAVTIRPIAVNTVGAAKGIFTYTIDFPSTGISDAKIDLTPVGTGTAQSIDILAARGVETSVEVVPGYYDVFITMQNSAGKTAGAYTAAHIYPGLETKAEYAFTEVDFVSEVYLAGTVSNGDAGMTIKAYSDAARITPLTIGTVDNANAWFIKIPISCPKAYFTISVGATTFNAGDSGSTDIPQNGRSGITLWFPYFYVSQGGDDTNGTGSKGNPFGSVQMAVDAVNTAYTSGNWPSGESALINISGEAK